VDEYLEGLATDVVRAAISFDLGDDESVEGDDEVQKDDEKRREKDGG